MGKNHSSVVVLRIRPKFWWMLPMGVRDNHTKYEPETQPWQSGMGVTSAGSPFQNMQFRAKMGPFLPKTTLQPAETGQMKGNSGYCTHAARLPHAKGPSRAYNSTICPRPAPKRPPRAPESVHIGRRQPQTKTRIEYWDRAGGGQNIVQEISTTNEVRTGKWMRAAQNELCSSVWAPQLD